MLFKCLLTVALAVCPAHASLTVAASSPGALALPVAWQSIGENPLGVLGQVAYLKASNTSAADEFGSSVSISGDTLVVGAPLEDSASRGVDGDASNDDALDSGAVFVYVRRGTRWSLEAYLKASNAEASDRFGASVAIDGDTLVVGALFEDSSSIGVDGDEFADTAALSGAAYVFARSGSTWSQEAYLKASNTDAGDHFGVSVALDGDTVIVGAQGESSGSPGVDGDQLDNSRGDAGAAYVFVRSSGFWAQQAYLKASNPDPGDRFGATLALSGETLVLGAPEEDSAAGGVDGDESDDSTLDAGASYVFVRNGSSWSQEAYLKASTPTFFHGFGDAVAVSGERIAVGASGDPSAAAGIDGDQNDTSAPNAGAAYTFLREGGMWSPETYFKASNPEQGDEFGHAVALDGEVLACSARYEGSAATGIGGDEDDNGGLFSGAAYLFARDRSNWKQLAYVKASNTGVGDVFGEALTLSSDLLAVGAPGEASAAVGVDGDQSSDGEPRSGAAYAYTVPTYVTSSEISRLGAPPNANALLSGLSTGPVVGTVWDPVIDHSVFFPTAQLDVLLVTTNGPANVPTPIGTLLCDLSATPEALLTSMPGVAFALKLPVSLALVGVSACAQGAGVGAGRVELTNALDVVVGNI